MTQVLETGSTNRSEPDVEADDRHRRRLEEERRFRVEQLAALEAESCPATHESVHRALFIAATTAVEEIDAALERLRNGRYGRCVTCSAGLPAERLDVLPMAALCMACHYNEQNCARNVSLSRLRRRRRGAGEPPMRPAHRHSSVVSASATRT